MKKLLAVLLAVMMVLGFAGCTPSEPKVDPNKKSEGTMTYAQYQACEVESKVVIEGYVVASQSYWNGATLYVADGDGAYFVYQDDKNTPNMTEEEWNKFGLNNQDKYSGLATKGVKVKVEGYKSEWAGEVEITDCTVTVLENEANWLPEVKDITSVDATKWVEQFGNQLVEIKNAKVTQAPMYNWDGSGTAGNNSDVYVSFEINGTEYSFLVESYLMYEGTQAYADVLALKVGDVVTLQGFMYAYNGPQMHITKITK